jgi:hypothetical protein
MNIAPLISALSENQRRALVDVIALISSGKKLKPSDLDAFADDTNCSGVRICEVLGVTRMGLHNWVVAEGCPRNPDKSYSLPAVVKWREAQLTERANAPTGLKEEKLKKEIEFLQARIDEKNETVIDRALHETILVARAGSLRSFFEKTFMSNAVHLAGRSVDEVRTVLYDLLTHAMDAYVGERGDNPV